VTRVLWVVPELHPWATAGGLGEVTAGLPDALAAAGVEVELVAPAYPALRAGAPDLGTGPAVGIGLASRPVTLRVLASRTAGGLPLHLVEAEGWFERPGLYGDAEGPYPDNLVRFGALAAGALQVLGRGGFAVLHAHDWPGGIAVAALAAARPHDPGLAPVRSLLTVHNLAHTHPGDTHDLGSPDACANEPWDPLAAGLVHAERVATVSPSYARAMRHGELGYADLLTARTTPVHGILNGIEPGVWDPARDPHLPAAFDASDLAGRATCQAALRREWGLRGEGPVFGFAARFVRQKGVDHLLEATPRLLATGANLVWLGDGDADLEAAVRASAAANPGRVAARIPFDRPTLHRVLAGIDALVMPSRSEPCGLTQLQALRLGAPVVAHRVGGLADTLGGLSGAAFLFAPLEDLGPTLERAVDAWADREAWTRRIREGMALEVGWESAARRYAGLYAEVAAQSPVTPPPPGPRFDAPRDVPPPVLRGFVHLLVRSSDRVLVQWGRPPGSPATLRLVQGGRITPLATVAGPSGHTWVRVVPDEPVHVELIDAAGTLVSNRVVPVARTGPDLPSS